MSKRSLRRERDEAVTQRPALLDVNLLVALFDPDHVHHDLAHDWFADSRHRGWATCAHTENGLVRVLTNPAYRSPVSRPLDVIERLHAFCASGDHHYWPDDVSLRDKDLFDPALIASHRTLTEVYLLGLAHRHRGRLATFDRGIPIRAVHRGDDDLLEVITPA